MPSRDSKIGAINWVERWQPSRGAIRSPVGVWSDFFALATREKVAGDFDRERVHEYLTGCMCGIAGVARFQAPVAEQRQLVSSMIRELWHRGPDGGGVDAEVDATIGMRRLAIVDIAGGQQPMTTDDGLITIVFNGEIYNAPAIREQMRGENGPFRTRSDTEVILRLYERFPTAVEERLAGMWAFAIHDRRRRRLVLSRDRFGIKPLFLADAGGSFAFASELRAFRYLHNSSHFSKLFELDVAAAHAMLAWSYVPELSTIYRGVRRVPPASRLEIDLSTGRQTQRSYWHLTPSTEASRVRSLDEATELVEQELRRAVREHLESDVPIASFLSGGIDSALVTAIASDESPNPITAYSIGFRHASFDESPYARQTATALNIPHEVQFLDEDNARLAMADALLAFDEPFGDSSALATYLLAKTVARTHKVALAGDGGDEVFTGYRKHKILQLRQAMARAPAIRRLLASLLSRIPTRTDRTHRFADLLRTAGRLANGLAGDAAETQVALTQVVPLLRVAPLVTQPTVGQRFIEPGILRFGAAEGSELQKTLACDLASPLANDMLTKVDRATMAVSLEARVPLLDHRLVEVGIGLPEAFTLPGGKRVLRALHQKRFGRALANRKKQGFNVPVERWLAGSLAASCDALFEETRLERFGILAPRALSGGRWRTWAARDPQVLWHALALAVWCEGAHGAGAAAVRDLLAPTPSTHSSTAREPS